MILDENNLSMKAPKLKAHIAFLNTIVIRVEAAAFLYVFLDIMKPKPLIRPKPEAQNPRGVVFKSKSAGRPEVH